jgi:hypothetical protein
MNEEVEYESNEEARESVAAGSVEVRARVCVDEAQFGAVGTLRLDAAHEACRRTVVRTGRGGGGGAPGRSVVRGERRFAPP